LSYEDDFLKQIVQLDEALEILKLYAENNSIRFETTAVGRKLHEIQPDLAARYDQFILKMNWLHSDELGSYAIFLKNIYETHDRAEAFYKRAIKADPKDAINLGNYAIFLHTIRSEDAEVFYQRALALDSNSPSNLGNYGQCLMGRGRIEEGLKHLRAAWERRDGGEIDDNAELAYSLWLGLLAGKEGEVWERVFKYCINMGFKRHVWNFDAMLAEAKKKLKSADFNYAKSLAEAFLDEAKVPLLENFERWKQLLPLDPAQVNADGTIRNG
jgi:tetratricopeptide (TPR) repeat protein